jgi:putative transposase
MRRGFPYLVAIMDWATRNVLSWRLSNTMEADFCIEALEEVLTRFGKPEIFNTGTTEGRALAHQGSQCASPRFTGFLLDAKVQISMDGRGRWMAYYNTRRPHSALAGQTPDGACFQTTPSPSNREQLNKAAKLSNQWGPPLSFPLFKDLDRFFVELNFICF